MKLQWDDPVPSEQKVYWEKWLVDFPHLSQFFVGCCIEPVGLNVISSSQLHHFPDASEVGFGSVSYLCLVNNQGDIHCSSLCRCYYRSKIHEQFADEQLQSYARENGLVTKEQFAYSKNSSTIVALLKVVDEWKWANDKGLITTAGFLVLWKAFDVIDHSLLLHKLKANGLSGAEHVWFRSYLTNRKQFVQCNEVNSNDRTVTHGVTQGSVLGPTLFCIHINSVVSTTLESSVFLYADDTDTYHSSPTLETGVLQINSNLQNISTWLRNSNRILNKKKTEAMIVAKKAPMSSDDILLNNNKLNVVETLKYLGVTTDSRLNWQPHISQLIERVSPKIALLNRLAGFLDTKILRGSTNKQSSH